MYDSELAKLFPKLCAVLKYEEDRKNNVGVEIVLKVNIEDFDGQSGQKVLEILNGDSWIEENKDRVEITFRTSLPPIETIFGEPSNKIAKS
jgi:hypothetical protein